FGPVKAMSGSTPARVGSMLSVGSPDEDGSSDVGLRRPSPTCCQQKPFRLLPAPGVNPVHGVPGAACFTALETKICLTAASSVVAPSFSSHATHGTGSFPATAAPPATEGFSAVRSVWMFREGRAPPRSCPEGSQRFAPALKRLAKMFVGGPKSAVGSYQATHGTVRPGPAKSIEGASASTFVSMFSDP